MTSVWVVVDGPDYDNYAFDLYVSREAALAAIKFSIGTRRGEWKETFEGRQVEFQQFGAKDWKGNPRTHIWSLEEQEVMG